MPINMFVHLHIYSHSQTMLYIYVNVYICVCDMCTIVYCVITVPNMPCRKVTNICMRQCYVIFLPFGLWKSRMQTLLVHPHTVVTVPALPVRIYARVISFLHNLHSKVVHKFLAVKGHRFDG